MKLLAFLLIFSAAFLMPSLIEAEMHTDPATKDGAKKHQQTPPANKIELIEGISEIVSRQNLVPVVQLSSLNGSRPELGISFQFMSSRNQKDLSEKDIVSAASANNSAKNKENGQAIAEAKMLNNVSRQKENETIFENLSFTVSNGHLNKNDLEDFNIHEKSLYLARIMKRNINLSTAVKEVVSQEWAENSTVNKRESDDLGIHIDKNDTNDTASQSSFGHTPRNTEVVSQDWAENSTVNKRESDDLGIHIDKSDTNATAYQSSFDHTPRNGEVVSQDWAENSTVNKRESDDLGIHIDENETNATASQSSFGHTPRNGEVVSQDWSENSTVNKHESDNLGMHIDKNDTNATASQSSFGHTPRNTEVVSQDWAENSTVNKRESDDLGIHIDENDTNATASQSSFGHTPRNGEVVSQDWAENSTVNKRESDDLGIHINTRNSALRNSHSHTTKSNDSFRNSFKSPSTAANTCRRGYCNSTICNDAGLMDCRCEGENECRICCRTNDSDCAPAKDLGLRSSESTYFYRHAGTACRQGKCTKSGVCSAIKFVSSSSASTFWIFGRSETRMFIFAFSLILRILSSSLF